MDRVDAARVVAYSSRVLGVGGGMAENWVDDG